MAQPMLMGAMIGAGTSLATGKSPLQGAILGGATGGLFGGQNSLFGGEIANFFGNLGADSSGLMPTDAFANLTQTDKLANLTNIDQFTGLPEEFGKNILNTPNLTLDATNSGMIDFNQYVDKSGFLKDPNLVSRFPESTISNPLAGATPIKDVNLFSGIAPQKNSSLVDFGSLGENVMNKPNYNINLDEPTITPYEKLSNFANSSYDWMAENPDKVLTGGLAIGSMLEPSPAEKITSAARGAGVNPAQLQGLITPNEVKPIVTAQIPQKRKYKIG